MTTKGDVMAELESIVDKTSLATVVQLLADIASEKAEHIRDNWQDRATASHWNHAYKLLSKAWAKLTV